MRGGRYWMTFELAMTPPFVDPSRQMLARQGRAEWARSDGGRSPRNGPRCTNQTIRLLRSAEQKSESPWSYALQRWEGDLPYHRYEITSVVPCASLAPVDSRPRDARKRRI